MSERRATRGRVVTITYTIEDDAGNLLERIDIPVRYLQGAGDLFPALERALEGSAAGDSVRVVLEAEEAFGLHDPNLTFTDDLDNVPPQFRTIGAEVPFQNERGEERTFIVSEIRDGRLTVDGNHPLAGKRLHYTVRVEDVRDATPEELRGGVSPFPGA